MADRDMTVDVAWKLKAQGGLATPYRKRVPLKEGIRKAVLWDRQTFNPDRIDPEIAERLMTRLPNIDWLIEAIGEDRLEEFYRKYGHLASDTLKWQIETYLKLMEK